MTSRVRFLCVALVLAVLLTVSSAPNGAAAGATIRGDPQAAREVEAAFKKFLEAKTWRSRMSGPAARGMVTTTEHVAPDRFHMTMEQGSTRTEIFMIGRQVWMRSGGSCTKMPAAPGIRNPKEMMEHGSAGTSITVSRLGRTTIAGTAAQGYELVIESQRTTVRERLYVAIDGGFPRRLEMESEQGSLTIDYTDFDTPITINDPPC